MGILDTVLGSKAKTKSAWSETPSEVKNLVTSNAKGLTGVSKDARNQYNADKAAGYQQYGGEQTAGFSGTEQAGLDALNRVPGQLDQTEGQINNLGGFDAMLADNPGMIDKLYNPFQHDVIDSTMSDLDRLGQRKQMERDAAAGAAGAFGGSRHGVIDSLAAGEERRADASTLAGLHKEGFDTAAGLASGDLNRQAGYNQNYLDVLKGLYSDKGNFGLEQSKQLESIGGTQRGIEQSKLDTAYKDFQAKQAFPWMNMARAQDVMGRTNPATDAAATPSLSTPSSPGLLNTVVGAAATGAGAAMMCDVRLKRDIERVGTLPSGAGLFSFSYLWDDPSDRRVAPVAQDLLRYVPEAVMMDANGFLLIDVGLVR